MGDASKQATARTGSVLGDPLAAPFEQLQLIRDEAAGVFAAIAIDSTRLGPAFGGIRRTTYPDERSVVADSLRLAAAMTAKCALAGIPGGGGKVAIRAVPGMRRQRAYRLVGRYVEQMGGRFYTGPDVGTEAGDLADVACETSFVAHASPRGGFGDPGDIARSTALGVHAGMRAALADAEPGFDLAGARVVVQGAGAVGGWLIRLLVESGAEVAFADPRHAVVEALVAELGRGRVRPRVLPVDRVLTEECDVFAPCALGAVVDAEVARQLPARAVVGSANNVLADPEAGRVLFDRGIRFAPDPVVTAGALIHGARFHLDGVAPPESSITAIGDSVAEVLRRSRVEGKPPEVVASIVANERLEAGGASHRGPGEFGPHPPTGDSA